MNKYIGYFQVKNNKISISDFTKSDAIDIDNTENGNWSVWLKNDKSSSEFYAYSKPYINKEKLKWEDYGEIYCDTGCIAFSDSEYFLSDDIISDMNLANFIDIINPGDKWYSMCCHVITETHLHTGIIPYGAVTQIGIDGIYDVKIMKHRKKIIGIKIIF